MVLIIVVLFVLSLISFLVRALVPKNREQIHKVAGIALLVFSPPITLWLVYSFGNILLFSVFCFLFLVLFAILFLVPKNKKAIHKVADTVYSILEVLPVLCILIYVFFFQ